MRWDELAAFMRASEAVGVTLLAGEVKLLESLAAAGVVQRGDGGWTAASGKADMKKKNAKKDFPSSSSSGGGLIALARGLPPRELGATLLHETCHALYYTNPRFASKCRLFYQGDSITDAQRDIWRSFLTRMGYDSRNEDLEVNEFQAYMLTERELFGPGGGTAHSSSDGGSKKKKGGRASSSQAGTGGDPGEQRELAAMQSLFNGYIGEWVPSPVPELKGFRCIFRDAS